MIGGIPPILAPDHLIDWIGRMEGSRGVRALSDREGPERGGDGKGGVVYPRGRNATPPSLRGNS
jgi:hypothetical protein